MTARLLIAASMWMTMGAPSAVAATPSPKPTNPNIVMIVLGDAGFSDLDAFGSEIRTLSIEAQTASGLRYNYFDSKAICTPTNTRTDDMTRDRGEIALNAQMLPHALKAAGYRIYDVGEWHHSTPPLAEPLEIFANRARYDDAFTDQK